MRAHLLVSSILSKGQPGYVPGAGALLNIQADGWQAPYNGAAPTFAPDTSPVNVTVTRTGYNSTATLVSNITDTLVINRRVRNLYPNQATDVTTATSFSPANAVALSDYVYQGETVSVGGQSVPNLSTKVSPVPVAAWVTPDRSLVGNSIGAGSGTEVEIVAFHRNARQGRFVAAVVFSFTDGTNTVTSSPVASTVISSRADDKNLMPVYRCPLVDITTLATGLITMNAKVYPWVGGSSSVLDSTASSVAREFSPRYFSKNATRAANPPLAYVASTGSDTTHAGWSTNAATAAAAPYLTLKGALDDLAVAANSGVTGSIVDGCRIRIVDTVASGSNVATARGQNIAGLVIERAPGTARTSAVVTFGVAWQPKLGTGTLTAPITESLLTFSDVSFQRTANVLPINGVTSGVQIRCVYDGVNFDSGSIAAAIINQGHVYIYGMVATNVGASNFAQATPEFRIMRGMSADLGNAQPEAWITVATTFTRPKGQGYRDPTKGGINYCNKFINPDSTNAPIFTSAFNTGDTITGFVAVQNLIELTHTTLSTPGFRISSDTPQHGNTVHSIVGYNTITGYFSAGRSNIWYDNTVGEVRTHDLIYHVGDLMVQLNTKGDVFSTNAAQIGQMPYTHGVGCQGNFSQFRPNSGNFSDEIQAYPGRGSLIGSSITTSQTPNANVWVDYRGTTGSAGTPVQGTGSGAGGGNYATVSGSPVRGIVQVAALSHDLAGAARSPTNDTAGAYV